jgi:hypothetical protein
MTDQEVARQQYLYLDNGDGSLFCIGIARPEDINANGVVRGPRPARIQINPGVIQREDEDQDSTEDRLSMEQNLQNLLSTGAHDQTQDTTTHDNEVESHPAEGAQTNHV